MTTSLQAAIRVDHERTERTLAKYREAWLNGDYALAVTLFRKLRRAVVRHLAWEEDELVQPLHARIARVYQHQVLQRDAERHRSVRDALDRIAILSQQSGPPDEALAIRVLQLVDKLEELLELHRRIFERQLVAELDGLLTPDAHEHVASALGRPRPTG